MEGLAGCAGTGDHHYGNNGASSNRSFSILCRSLLSRVLVVGFYQAKRDPAANYYDNYRIECSADPSFINPGDIVPSLVPVCY